MGVCASVLSVGVTLNVMNKGLEEFHAMDRPFDMSAPHPGVAVQQQQFSLLALSRIEADKTTKQFSGG